jgi:hypothetical protein
MTVAEEKVGLEVTSVKIQESAGGGDWYASVRISMTGFDGKPSTGWVHVSKKGYKLSIEDWDDCGEGSTELIDFLVSAESDTIIGAVKEKMETTVAR